jgi:hypothetical protein
MPDVLSLLALAALDLVGGIGRRGTEICEMAFIFFGVGPLEGPVFSPPTESVDP